MKNIQKIESKRTRIIKKKKVCAYARVSSKTDRLHNSLHQQVSYYNDLISSNNLWELVGIYADEGISGSSTKNRLEFNRMIQDCEDGKIDIILTKSISRFARNTVDLLNTVRDLKKKGIEVIFEKENISSLSADGELMLTILASFAQEELISLSENIKWVLRKGYEKGVVKKHFLYGYRWDGGKYVIIEEEAEVIRFVFQSFLEGKSSYQTAKEINAKNIKSFRGKEFNNITVLNILRQEKYTGNTVLQKYYSTDPLEKRLLKNRGHLPKYYVEDTHPPIIDIDVFNKVQKEHKRRLEEGARGNPLMSSSCFTSRIKCVKCGVKFHSTSRRRKEGKYRAFTCARRKEGKKPDCDSVSLSEFYLRDLTKKVLNLDEFDEDKFNENIKMIEVYSKDKIVVKLFNGSDIVMDNLNLYSGGKWTEEMKRKQSDLMKRIKNKGEKNE